VPLSPRAAVEQVYDAAVKAGKGGSVLRRTVSEYLLAFYARKENRGLDIFADCNALQ